MIQTLAKLSVSKKFVHGNLDSSSVFVERLDSDATAAGEPEFLLRMRIDTLETHTITRMFKAILAPVADAAAEDTQEETVSSEEQVKVMTAFEEF